MKKILIVDDEYIVRIGIKSILDWEQFGYEIIGEADNGKTALEKIQKLNPDIVLTDIKMPIMDGLELIKETTSFNNNIKFVVLSGYNDFETVKSAMKLGAVDYIFKLDINPDDLLKILDEIEINIKSSNSKTLISTKDMVNKLMTTPFNYIKQNEYKHLMESLNLKTTSDQMKIHLLSINNYWTLTNKANTDITKFAVINLISEVITESGSGVVVDMEGSNIVILYPFKVTAEVIEKNFKIFSQYLEMYLSLSISCVFEKTNIRDFRKTVLGSIVKIEERFWYETDSSRIIKEKRIIIGKGTFDADEFRNCLETSDIDASIKELNRLLQVLYDTCLTPAEAREKLTIIYGLIRRYCDKTNPELPNTISHISLYDIITKYEFLCDIRTAVTDYLIDYKKVLLNNNGIIKPEVLNAQKYIRKNISKPISVYEIANHIGMNESYFSYLFKKETGENITEYILDLRIRIAKKLLRTTSMKVHEIANEVGIENANYFSVIFKKNTGMTTKEYKRKIQK